MSTDSTLVCSSVCFVRVRYEGEWWWGEEV
jgi:hypothetical protein